MQEAADWSKANELAADFADCVIREVGLLGGEHVDSQGVLCSAGYPRLLVHAQMQGEGGMPLALSFAGYGPSRSTAILMFARQSLPESTQKRGRCASSGSA